MRHTTGISTKKKQLKSGEKNEKQVSKSKWGRQIKKKNSSNNANGVRVCVFF